jgi:alkylation response protein AidB-like acyl-CoA dehydrogenase
MSNENRDEQFNKPLFDRCAELGLLGMTISTKYGGSGEHIYTQSLVNAPSNLMSIQVWMPQRCVSWLKR